MLPFSGQLYTIAKIRGYRSPCMYLLKELDGTLLPGQFYGWQLVKTAKPSSDYEWPIDKILKTRKRNGKTENYVSFLFYPKKYNQWVGEVSGPKHSRRKYTNIPPK